jgi:hypothetical protein
VSHYLISIPPPTWNRSRVEGPRAGAREFANPEHTNPDLGTKDSQGMLSGGQLGGMYGLQRWRGDAGHPQPTEMAFKAKREL